MNVTSNAHRLSGIVWEDVNFEGKARAYDEWVAYGQSNTAVILSALQLVNGGKVPKAFAVHPGVVQTLLLKPHSTADVMSNCEFPWWG